MDFAAPIPELQREVRQFVVEHVAPLEAQLDEARFRDLLPALADVRARVKERGWWAPPLPRELGGMGLSLLEFAFLSEELGRSPLGHFAFNVQAPDISTMEVLVSHATGRQRERFLEPLAAGAIRSCFCMTEPDYPGSNPVWMGTTARRDGDGYVLDGRKWFATGADGAAFALVMALTDPAQPDPHRRASLFLVPCDTPGFRLVRNLPVMGQPGQDWASHSEVHLADCQVPEDLRLGQEGEGFRLAQERLGPGRIHHCMRWIGIAERAFDLMCGRAVRRELEPGRPLADQQAVQHMVADSRAEIEAARLMV
ncbi:MAG: acyl-CoA dehydrogenase family protein, partial [Candidatus Eremiobacterota bacterium]